jgi:hypothetical protein
MRTAIKTIAAAMMLVSIVSVDLARGEDVRFHWTARAETLTGPQERRVDQGRGERVDALGDAASGAQPVPSASTTASESAGYIESPSADLTVTAVGPRDRQGLERFNYTVAVANNGPSGASHAVLVVSRTGPGSLDSIKATQGTCARDDGMLTCDLGNLANSAVATVTVEISPYRAETISLDASVRAAEADPNPANDRSSASTSVRRLPSLDPYSPRPIGMPV